MTMQPRLVSAQWDWLYDCFHGGPRGLPAAERPAGGDPLSHVRAGPAGDAVRCARVSRLQQPARAGGEAASPRERLRRDRGPISHGPVLPVLLDTGGHLPGPPAT